MKSETGKGWETPLPALLLLSSLYQTYVLGCGAVFGGHSGQDSIQNLQKVLCQVPRGLFQNHCAALILAITFYFEISNGINRRIEIFLKKDT